MSSTAFAEIMRAARRRPLWVEAPTTVAMGIDRERMEKILPHRGAMLMIDEITAVDLPQRAIRASRRIAEDDPAFAGHFPGAPVYPAFLQFEIAGQAGICLLELLHLGGTSIPAEAQPRNVRPIKLHHGVLLSEIAPGDRLTALAVVLEDEDLTATFAGQLLRGDEVCSAMIVEVCFVDP